MMMIPFYWLVLPWLVSWDSGDLAMQPLSGVEVFDLVSGDDCGTSTKGIHPRFGAVV
jgi:hypothetical protein